MRLKIHRGAHAIGGSCVELQAQGQSILIDLGLPLDAPEAHPSLLPDMPGLVDGSNRNLVGIVLSHIHGDHNGLTGLVHASVPVFMGERSRSMLLASAPFLPWSPIPETIRTYQSETAFALGPFRITPWLTDHSALDAYSLLVEADGKRVFYSGDLRVHGRKARLVERLLEHPPTAIDCLLLEGTTLSRHHDLSRRSETEQQLEARMVECIKDTEGLVLTAFSPQNIDRFVTVFRAARRAGRTFIADLYLAHVIEQLKIPSLPRADAGGFRVYLPDAQKRRIVNSRAFGLVRPYRASRIFKEEIAAEPGRWAMLFRESMCSDIECMGTLTGAALLYSLWPGYLDQPQNQLRAWCEANNVPLHFCHTSGHADPIDLVRIAVALQPRMVVPIHTEAARTMQSLIPRAKRLPDGKWLSL